MAGLEPGIAYYGTDSKVIENLLKKSNEKPIFAFIHSTNNLYKMIKNGLPVKHIFSIEGIPPYVLVGKKGFKLNFLDPKAHQFKGIRIAVPSYWYKEDLPLKAALAAKFSLVDAGDPRYIPKFVTAKNSDLGAVTAAALSAAMAAGVVPVAPLSKLIPNYLSSSIMVNANEIYQNKKEIKAFVSAMFRASEFFYNNKSQSVEIIAEQLRLHPAKISKKHVELMYDTYKTYQFFSKTGEVTESEIKPWQNMIAIDYNKAVDMSFVNEIKENGP